MRLIETYSLATGSKISKPHIQTNPYPLPFTKYITLQNSSGMDSKNYSYWEIVLDMLAPYLKQNNIEIVQIGDKDTHNIKIAHSLCGKTTIYQTAYIIKNSLLHIGNDSFACHMAGAFGVPLVAVYGPTTIANHGPYWYNKDKTFLIESDRDGKMPTFAAQESEKTVDMIKPEVIANKALLALIGEEPIDIKTVFIGASYNDKTFEVIPDTMVNPEFQKQAILNIRMDYYFDQHILGQILSYRACNILTDKPIDLEYLRGFRKNIRLISYELDDTTELDYIQQVQKLGIKLDLVASPKCDLSDIRFKFLDFEVYEKNQFDKNMLDLPDGITYNNLKFTTNKFILSHGKMYTSHSHVKHDLPINNVWNNHCDVIDEDIFWEDLPYFNFYYNANRN